ncbi:MAG: hypothetical protein BJ554DRAFT_908 [Olpidium bornovanus]|uniref:Uncharacterized protein n=1 Tax=Olpidium bornovanus TaxID=278681 RepID=A0A8H7ZT26_9FUNG|nr:MAG: hypothetical protein BJ554DRAFT_908 [Olpidium bornovanus]
MLSLSFSFPHLLLAATLFCGSSLEHPLLPQAEGLSPYRIKAVADEYFEREPKSWDVVDFLMKC